MFMVITKCIRQWSFISRFRHDYGRYHHRYHLVVVVIFVIVMVVVVITVESLGIRPSLQGTKERNLAREFRTRKNVMGAKGL